MNITVKTKTVYGRDLIYPACETAEKFAALLQVKTFSNWHLKAIEGLGYTVTHI